MPPDEIAWREQAWEKVAEAIGHKAGRAAALAGTRCSTRARGRSLAVPSFSCGAALARNLRLLPVILAHGVRRLVPF